MIEIQIASQQIARQTDSQLDTQSGKGTGATGTHTDRQVDGQTEIQ